jgi:hypothetical protein
MLDVAFRTIGSCEAEMSLVSSSNDAMPTAPSADHEINLPAAALSTPEAPGPVEQGGCIQARDPAGCVAAEMTYR